MIKHCSFDLWGTLITRNPDFKHESTLLFLEIFGPFRSNVLASKLFQMGKYDSNIAMEISGIQMPYAQILSLCVKKQLSFEEMSTFNNKVQQFRVKIIDLVVKLPPKLISGIRNILHELYRRDILITLLSNTNIIPGIALRLFLKEQNVLDYFWQLSFSDEIELCKPNPKAYQSVALYNPKLYEERLHVGDNPFTDSGASIFPSFIISKENPITNLIPFIDASR